MVHPPKNYLHDFKLRRLNSFLWTWGAMAGVSSSATFKGLLGEYFSIATVHVIEGGWVGKKYNVKLTFCVAT